MLSVDMYIISSNNGMPDSGPIVVDVVERCHATCMLKTHVVDFEKNMHIVDATNMKYFFHPYPTIHTVAVKKCLTIHMVGQINKTENNTNNIK